MRALIALGGNAMTAPDGRATPEAQEQAVTAAMAHVAELVAGGVDVVLTHGNGPQVGNLLVKNEVAAHVVPPVPLDWCGADPGDHRLPGPGRPRRGPRRPFSGPPRGRARDPHAGRRRRPRLHVAQQAGRPLPAGGAGPGPRRARETWQDRGEKGWRRVIASPEPVEVLDAPAVVALIAAGFLVVAAGGGGIPVVRRTDGTLHGVEAVLDKDLTAALLARSVGADVLVIATDVDHAVIGWGTPQARQLGR